MNAHALDSQDAAVLSRDVDDLLLQLRGLVLVRDVLAERGASREDIRAHSEEAERIRGRLAQMILG